MPKQELLLIPGPTMVLPEILAALGQETLAHTDPRFVELFSRSLAGTRRLFSLDGGAVFVLAGSGTLAMEMALLNTVMPGERILVVSQGYFGDRFVQIAERFGIVADRVASPWGERVLQGEVAKALTQHSYKAVTITHVDTSTGVEAEIETLVPLIRAHGALCLLDGVCASGAIEEDMSRIFSNPENTIDLVLSGSQKALGLPPGLLVLAMGERALAARKAMPRIPAYYADALNWLPVMEDPFRYFATPPVNLVFAFEKALEIIFREGLKARYRRHRLQGKAVRAALRTLGFTPLASEEVASSTVTCLLYPDGLDDAAFRAGLAQRGVVVAGSLAHLKGKAFRFGHLGNVDAAILRRAITEMAEVLHSMGRIVDGPSALCSFDETLRGEGGEL
jgi:alanine-glyoxylate transaminase/serine-glyoxylate transaminase/serine-pyruvate transaminase